MRNSSNAAMLSWKILEVTPPKWPVPQEAAALTEEQCRTLRSNERETFMFDRLTDILKETQRNFDEWTESIVKEGYVCPICLQGMAEDVTGVTTLFNEA
jgi:hypothetical protein